MNPSAPTAVQRLSQQLNSQRISMFGAKMVPSPVPRAFVQIPWNSWTYEFSEDVPAASANTPLTVTVTKILQNLTDNIGLDATASIRVKIQSAQVWVTASGLQYPSLTADFYEINGNTANAASIRSTQSDKGTLNMPARAGYVYPVSDSRDVLNTGDGGLRVVVLPAASEGAKATIRVQILWQSRKAT
jgi:hypothetical protein